MNSHQKHCYCLPFSFKVKVIAKIKSKWEQLGNNKHATQKQNKQEICPVAGLQLICQIIMNDLLPEQGHQRSRVIR